MQQIDISSLATKAIKLTRDLVDISSPSGDQEGFEKCVLVVEQFLQEHLDASNKITTRRISSSTDGFPDDLLLKLEGDGNKRIVLLGHMDTVVAHRDHLALNTVAEKLVGSGSYDMKAGVAIALATFVAISDFADSYAELAVLLVSDEEWRSQPFKHGELFQDWDLCLCYEGGQASSSGELQVVTTRKAAGSMAISAKGLSSHAGSKPDDGINALLAICQLAIDLEVSHDPAGIAGLSVVPTIINAGEAINIVPSSGELAIDCRANELASIEHLLSTVPDEINGAQIDARINRRWPGMKLTVAADSLISEAEKTLGRKIGRVSRGGASDASHLAQHVVAAIDGLGPLGGGAHAPDEHVLPDSYGRQLELSVGLAISAL